MLAKELRLPIKSIIKSQGKSSQTAFFRFTTFKPEKDYTRIGVIVSKKVFPKATKRNEIRRIVFDFFKDKTKNIIPPKDVLVSVLRKVVSLKGKHAIIDELEKAYGKHF